MTSSVAFLGVVVLFLNRSFPESRLLWNCGLFELRSFWIALSTISLSTIRSAIIVCPEGGKVKRLPEAFPGPFPAGWQRFRRNSCFSGGMAAFPRGWMLFQNKWQRFRGAECPCTVQTEDLRYITVSKAASDGYKRDFPLLNRTFCSFFVVSTVRYLIFSSVTVLSDYPVRLKTDSWIF